MKITIRRALPVDAAAVAPLWRALLQGHARLQPGRFRAPPTEGGAQRAVDRLLRATSRREQVLLIAESDEVVGLVHVALHEPPRSSHLVMQRRALLREIVVAESVRRRGVGRRLVEAAATWARTRGAEELLLTVWQGNRAAERFYQALGFGPLHRVLGLALDPTS